MTRLNIHMYPSAFTHETRILRITKSLLEHQIFDEILVIAALRDKSLNQNEDISTCRKVWRVPCLIGRSGPLSKLLNALEWSAKVMWRVLRLKQVHCLNAHSLSVLPVCVFIKYIKGCKLIYDTHEIETETTETKGLRQQVSRITERVFIRFADAVAYTSEGHGKWYRDNYKNLNSWVIRNCPYYDNSIVPPKHGALRKTLGLSRDDLLFIYQGQLSPPRGVLLLLKTFRAVTKDKHIVFMGFGVEKQTIIDATQTYSNIHYHPAVPPDEVRNYTSDADIGVHMMDDSCANHLYALPNKPMEYFNAGIPAIVTNLPEMGKLAITSRAGWVIDVGSVDQLTSLVKTLTRQQIEEKARFARQWTQENNWELEEKILLKMYSSINFGLTGLQKC